MSEEKDIEKLLADGQTDDNIIMELYNDIVEMDTFLSVKPGTPTGPCPTSTTPRYCGNGIENYCFVPPNGSCQCKC